MLRRELRLLLRSARMLQDFLGCPGCASMAWQMTAQLCH